MQAAGGLRKRRRRNLAKINGLCVIDDDVFDINAMYWTPPVNHNRGRWNSANSQRSRRNPWVPGSGQVKQLERQSRSQTMAISNVNSVHEVRKSRPALLSANSINRLKQIMLLGVFSLSFPWQWNAVTCQIDIWNPAAVKLWQIGWTILSVQSTGLLGFQVYSFISRMNQMRDPDGSYRPLFMNSVCVLWYAYALALNLCMYQYRNEILGYVNNLLALNKKLVAKYVVDLSNYKEGGTTFLNVSIPINMSQAVVSTVLFAAMPCFPWYLYSYVYSPDLHWIYLVPGCVQQFVYIGQILALYLLIGWICVMHANSVEFWLQEAQYNSKHLSIYGLQILYTFSRNNETGSTTEGIRKSHKAAELYRCLQLLNVHFNRAMAPAAIPIVKVMNWTALVPCGYILIRSMNHKFLEEFPGILSYPFGFVGCTTSAYGMLQLGAEMSDISYSFLNSWSSTKHQDFRRVLVSCPMLRMKIGTLYSLSVSTTITYFKSCTDYIINAIITFS